MKLFSSHIMRSIILTLTIVCFIGSTTTVFAANNRQQIYPISGSSSGVVSSKNSTLCTYNFPKGNTTYYINYVYESTPTDGDYLKFVNKSNSSEEYRISLTGTGALKKESIFVQNAGNYELRLVSGNSNEHIYAFDIYYLK